MPYERKQEKPQSVVQVDSKVMFHTIISSYYHYHKLHKELAYQKCQHMSLRHCGDLNTILCTNLQRVYTEGSVSAMQARILGNNSLASWNFC